MKSTGEVMGIHSNFGGAFAKSQFASGTVLPEAGAVFLSVTDGDKAELKTIARRLVDRGFSLVATHGTAQFLKKEGFEVTPVNKVREGSPHVVDMLGEGALAMVINTPEGWKPFMDSRSIRMVANELRVPTVTTIAAAGAVAQAIGMVQDDSFLEVRALQDYHS
jgi:carbamoyl-phosphate synthase large subunit